MKVLVTGGNGQLGRDVCRTLESRDMEYLGLSSRELDVTDPSDVERVLCAFGPDAVIHCAAYTQVDRAETEQAHCMAVNMDGARYVAESCRAVGARMIYPSTDYVFSGKGSRPWEVADVPAPCNFYGVSKRAGEQAVQTVLDAAFVVRVSWLFGSKGNNFVKTMLRLARQQPELAVVCDQVGSPTYTVDLAQLLVDMAGTTCYGVYHATNEGECSWADFAKEIFRQRGQAVTVREISSDLYSSAAVRPLNSRLSKRSLDEGGFRRLPEWRDGLARLLRELSAV